MATCNCHNCRFVLPRLIELLESAERGLDTDNRGEWEFSTEILDAIKVAKEGIR